MSYPPIFFLFHDLISAFMCEGAGFISYSDEIQAENQRFFKFSVELPFYILKKA